MIDLKNDPAAIPARRVGALMRGARSQAGLSLRSASRKLGITKTQLMAWERGDERITDDELDQVADLYGVGTEALAPARRGVEIDRAHHTMRIGHHIEVLNSPDPTADEILGNYLHALYELRGAKPTDPIPLRDDDLNSLADALGNVPAVIEQRLVELMGVTREEAIRLRRIILRRRVLTPAAGLALGAGMLGGLSSFSSAKHSTAPPLAASQPQAQATTAPATPPATAPSTTAAPTTAPVVTAPPATSVPAPTPVVRHHVAAPPTTSAPSIDAPGASQIDVTDNSTPSTITAPPSVDTTPPTTTDPTPVVNIDAPGDGQAIRP